MKALVFDPPRARWPLTRLLGMVVPRTWTGPLGGLRLVDVPPPALPGEDWVRVRTRLGGICGTDLALITLRNHPATILQRFASFPAVLGHENVGTIDAVGSAVAGWRVGQRVCIEPSLSCAPRGIAPVCRSCAAGRISLCENTDRGRLPPGLMIGLNRVTGGSWSPCFVAHESQLVAVPDDVSDEQAVLVDPVGCGLHAVLRRLPEPHERVLVNGGGILAIGLIASLRALGHANRVVAVVRHPFQAECLRRCGADDVRVHGRRMTTAERYDDVAAAIGGRRIAARFGNQAFVGGVELTYNCVGSGGSLTDAMKWTAPRGTVVMVGTSQIAVVDTTPLWFSELQVIGCNGRQRERLNDREMHTYEAVFELVRRGRLNLSGLLTHRFRLADYREALERLAFRGASGVIKAAFEPVESDR
ncbi:MAG: alcohol dehydrogenase catalytic domain-containing protein [Phycisphaerae bacterium]|nr:alcohol dehydrogenase catalytic domain-containing protein [Phycisphaerae bacterium]